MANRKAIKKVLGDPEEDKKLPPKGAADFVKSFPVTGSAKGDAMSGESVQEELPYGFTKSSKEIRKKINTNNKESRKGRIGTSKNNKDNKTKLSTRIKSGMARRKKERSDRKSNKGDGGGFECSGVVCDG